MIRPGPTDVTPAVRTLITQPGNRLRLLLHGINFAPELTGIGKYTGEMAAWLGARGHDVRVVTAPPYYPEWRVHDGYRGGRYRREHLDGAAVWRCPLWVPAVATGARRVAHLASFAVSSTPALLAQAAWRPHVVLTVAPALLSAPAAWLAASLMGARTWLHIQDFEVDAAFELGLLRSPLARRQAEGFERWLLQRFDRVSTISPSMLERLAAKGVDEGHRTLLPNWADLRSITPMAGSPLRAELGLHRDTVVALYSGNMGEKQGLDILVHAAQRIQGRDDLTIVLCGDGAARARLEQATRGLQNVRWLPLQPTARLNDLLNLADFHLLPQRADAADLVMPSKLTGMLASGRPVVATASPGTQVASVVSGVGVVVRPGDVDAFAAAITGMAADRLRRAELGRLARAYAVEHFDRDDILSTFEARLVELAALRAAASRQPRTVPVRSTDAQ